jgi:hypothetical protein
MKVRRWGGTLTSGLALLALLLAALQMVVLLHGARPPREAVLHPGGGSVVVPSRRGAFPDGPPQGGTERAPAKPPREPHPPARNFRHNDFGPKPARKVAA